MKAMIQKQRQIMENNKAGNQLDYNDESDVESIPSKLGDPPSKCNSYRDSEININEIIKSHQGSNKSIDRHIDVSVSSDSDTEIFE